MNHHRAIKEENIAINRDLVNNRACRLSHYILKEYPSVYWLRINIQIISSFYITFDKLFELITTIRFSNISLEFVN